MNKNRAAIYVFYDKGGIVDSYIIFMLQALKVVCNKLVVVCNGQVNDEGRELLESVASDVVVRENEGFDAWAYKTGMEYIGWNNLEQYDELVLMNDTVFGPIYPFQIMFDEMGKKNLDFWGITKHGECANYNGLTRDGMFPEHIQTYFLTISNTLLTNSKFKEYWDNLRTLKSWNETVSFIESQLTKHFADLGFSWDVYVNTDKDMPEFSDVSLIQLMPYELIRDYKCPIIKRKNFSIEYLHFLAFSIGNSVKKAFDYIRYSTTYDTDLIWDHILRTADLRHIKDNLHLNYVLPDNYLMSYKHGLPAPVNHKDEAVSAKVAIFAHITYEDQIDFCMSYISSAIEFADIYITTLAEKTKKSIQERFNNIEHNELKIIVMPENSKGRDVGALWVMLKPYMENYDYICWMHNKKSPQDKPLTIGRGFAQRCFENMLASKDYVHNLIDVFNENPRLGMLFSPPVIHGPYRLLISNLWGVNYQNTLELAKKLGINVPIEGAIDPIFPAGGMFWFRPKALKKLVDYDWKYEEFPDEPLPVDGSLGHAIERIYCFAAQSEGYYSGWVVTEDFSVTDTTSLWYLLTRHQLHSPWGLLKRNMVEGLKKRQRLYVFLRNIYRKCKMILRRLRLMK
ncbi:MAG: rhamnan synthesis F family protein [Oscillospiraceae bacterium]|nr:rhamnan synthesis F family protein [Oscillospiraceae bacterium]